ncbi:MAG: hypothetical protein LBJ00_12280 [Planctomycetaceae bacterium]|jgi:hypothetical protein|nr:hypothetical protein [Planctomycetaceae bacterium]
MNCVSLLFSHLPKQISGRDKPIQQLKTATAFLKTQNITILTSAGQTHWDCILSAVLDSGIPVHLVVAKPMTIEEISAQFSYEFNSYNIVESWEARDKFICSNAGCLYPLWLRRNGHISQLITKNSSNSSRVDLRFACSSYRFVDSGLKYLLSDLSAEVELLPDNYLWHWTRGKHGIWAGETRRNYCSDILNSNSPPRDALATLTRILREKIIRASGLKIASNTPVTAFTENNPADSKAMFTWRKDRQQMNFEPYGIGIEKEYLKTKGAKLLQYGTTPDWNTMKFDNRWKNENEWRIHGDFLLEDDCTDKMIVVVRKPHEIAKIQESFNGKIVSYENK